jgi:hypothetical protein
LPDVDNRDIVTGTETTNRKKSVAGLPFVCT